MWRAEWTITVRQAVLSLAQIKYQYFDPERCKAEHNFFRYKPSKQVISWQFIDKPMIYCWLTAQALQQLGDRGSFQDNFAQKEGPDSKFSEQHFFLLCVKADFNVLLQQCRDCPHCKITSVELAIHSLSIKLDHFKSKRIIHQSQFYACWVIRALGPNLEILFCAQKCSVSFSPDAVSFCPEYHPQPPVLGNMFEKWAKLF